MTDDDYLREHYKPSVHGRVGEIAETLGRPKAWVRSRAHRLGLTGAKPYWSRSELNILEDWAGRRSIEWLAKKTGRSPEAVRHQLKRQRISARARGQHYSPASLAECFGVSKTTVENWIKQGRLQAERRGDRLCITDEHVRAFIWKHPLAWPMQTTDQLWLVTVLVGVGEFK